MSSTTRIIILVMIVIYLLFFLLATIYWSMLVRGNYKQNFANIMIVLSLIMIGLTIIFLVYVIWKARVAEKEGIIQQLQMEVGQEAS